MSDLFSKMANDRSPLQNILSKIPGYKGYQEMSERRAADRMMRDFVVGKLKEQMGRLINVEKKLLSKGGLSFASASRTAKMNFQTFIDRINTANPGYAGFYDAVKVGNNELEELYQFDAALINSVDKFADAIDHLERAIGDNDQVNTAIGALEVVANEANGAYSLRNDVLSGLTHDGPKVKNEE